MFLWPIMFPTFHSESRRGKKSTWNTGICCIWLCCSSPVSLAIRKKNKRSRKVNQPAKNVNEKEDTQIEFPTPPAKLLKRAITKNTTPPCMPTVFPAQKSLSLNRKETAKSPPQLPEKTPASFSETTGDQGFSNWYYFMCPIDYNQSFSLPAVIETGQEIQPGCSGFVAPKSIAVFKIVYHIILYITQ